MAEEEEVTPAGAVHVYAYVNYYEKGPLCFYNDDKDLLSKPKPPLKPRKSMY
jgi:hypothetical protein